MTPLEIATGLIGLALIALGSALHPFVGSLAVPLLILPAGTLLVGAAAGLQVWGTSRRSRKLAGLGLIAASAVGAAVLAFLTPEPFFGLRTPEATRPFILPWWGVLLELHVAWSAVAIVGGLGIRVGARASIERCLAVVLSLFALYPGTAGLCWLFSVLAT